VNLATLRRRIAILERRAAARGRTPLALAVAMDDASNGRWPAEPQLARQIHALRAAVMAIDVLQAGEVTPDVMAGLCPTPEELEATHRMVGPITAAPADGDQ